MRRRRIFILAAALAVLVLAATPARALDSVTLELKWFPQFQFAGYYAAKEKGFYAEEGLDVTIRPRDPATNPIDRVLDGKAEFGISDASLILHRLRGRPVVVLAAVFQHSPLVLLTRAEDNILGPLELKGKRVMRQRGLDDAALTAMFHQEGMADADVIDVPHNFDDEALLKGEADAMSAYLTNQPFLYDRLGVPVRVINPINYGIDFYGDMLFTGETLMRTRPELALRFRRASMRGWDYALKNPDEVIDWLTTKYGADKTPDHLHYEARMTERMIVPSLVEIGHLNTERFRRIAEIYQREGMAPIDGTLDGIDYRDYFGRGPAIPDWALWLIGTVAALAVLSTVLIALNRHLKSLVRERTADLARARDNLQRYVDIVDKHVITSSTDAKGIITYASDAFARISKYAKEDLVGRPHNIVRHPDMPKELYKDLWATIRAGKSWEGEIKNRAKDGGAYWVDVTIEPDFAEDGSISGYTAIRYDITDKKRIEELSVTDRLTGLYNRLKLDEAFAAETERAERYRHPLAVVLFDLDHFKSVNDTFGHQAGDTVLVHVADLVRDNLRTIDIAGRWGGEEFVILCPETDLEGARTIAEKLREAIESHDFPGVGHKTSSFGVAALKPEEDAAGLIRRADEALYRAKETGRNRVEVAG